MGATYSSVDRIYFQQGASILARNPKTILKNREYCPYLRGLLENRAKIDAAVKNRCTPLSPLNAENTRALLELNATIISMTRANSLDRLICTVRDCFGSHGNSYPVDSSTGKKSDLCFARRSTPEAQITAHLDPVLSLVEKEMKSVKNQTSLLRSLGWVQKKIPSVHYEDLTAFESGEQFLQRSSEAWMKVMAAVGLPFKSLDQAKQTLKKLERKSEIFYNSRPVPGSQEKSVHNWDQVKKALLKSGNPDIAAMIRTSDT